MITITGTPAPDDLTGDRVWDAEKQAWVYAETSDEIFGLAGDDSLYGGALFDTLWGGGTGEDMLFGDAGDDVPYCHQGHNTLSGAQGNDSLVGGLGDGAEVEHDVFDGGGNDRLTGMGGDHSFNGGTATTRFLGTAAPMCCSAGRTTMPSGCPTRHLRWSTAGQLLMCWS